jgi:AcrR family transcriptional regulator
VAAQKQQIHDALVRAAIDVISEQGFAAARVQTIARRARVGYGTFYNYFSSKMALIEDVLTRIYEEIHESWYRVPRGLEPIERIRRGLNQALATNQRYGPIITALSEAGNLSQNVNQLRNAQWERDVRDTMTLIRVYEKEGYQPPGDPYLLAMALTSMTDEVVRRWLEGGAATPKEQIAETLVAVIQSVLLHRGSSED